jgi:HEAT repeat protein
MNSRKVIATLILAAILWGVIPSSGWSQSGIDRKVDSLFMIASSGSVKYKDMVQPAIDSAAAIGGPAVPRLLSKLDTKSPRERVALSQILKKIGSPAVPALLVSIKLDNGLAVERAATSLGEIGDTSAVDGLLGIVGHSRWQVRDQAIGSLGRLKSHRADAAVMAAMADSIGLVRKSAAVACGQMGINQSIPELVHLLGDSFYGARMPASLALLSLDTGRVVQAIADSVNSENRVLGNLGCWVLGKLATPPALKLLAAQMTDPDPERRAHAACALVAADPQGKCLDRQFYLLTETDRLARLKVESAIEAAKNVQPAAR